MDGIFYELGHSEDYSFILMFLRWSLAKINVHFLDDFDNYFLKGLYLLLEEVIDWTSTYSPDEKT